MRRSAPEAMRPGWRLLCFLLALVASWMAADAFIYPLFTIASAVRGQPIAAFPWVAVIAALLAHAVLLEWIAPAAWQTVALGRRGWRWPALGAGALAGGLLVVATTAIGLLVGHYVVVSTQGTIAVWWRVAIQLLLLLAPSALWEELVFRGYLLSVSRDLIGTRGALLATGVAFAAIHVTNPGAAPIPLLVVAAAGYTLGAIRLYTDSLPAAWLAHLAWNWLLAAGLHADVSGLAFETPLWQLVERGPDWLTGGRWGPEGGVYALAAFILVAGWLLWSHARAASTAEPAGRHLST